jgi:hypothetical protein
VVIDFVFHNIQPLKDRVHPAYMYAGVRDPSQVTNRQITKEDVSLQVGTMLKGDVFNEGAPLAYLA